MPQPKKVLQSKNNPQRPPLLPIIAIPVVIVAVLVVGALASRAPEKIGLATPTATATPTPVPATPTPPPSETVPTAKPAPIAAGPTAFAVSNITLHNPMPVTNTDKVGGSNKACQVSADITVTKAGTVTYYWESYHPEYYNPSLKGLAESATFTAAGTKTVTLPTYVSNDSRRFTLHITSPGSTSRATGTQVWCPAS